MILKITLGKRWILILCSSFVFSCAPTSYFKTPNDIYKKKVTLFMKDGTRKEGLLTVLFEENADEFTNSKLIDFVPTDSTKQQQLNLRDIKSYTYNGASYVAKLINLNTSGDIRALFVKLISPEKSTIQLFQLEQKYKSNPTGEDKNFYYIGVPSHSAVQLIELHSNFLVPNFERKMAEFVSDCPSLVNKIRNKEKNYSYVFLTATFRKVEIMKRIIQEYDSCSRH